MLPRFLLSRPLLALALAAATLVESPLCAADPAPFDLPGPGLRISVTRGDRTLPIAEVPNLATGDTLTIEADLPSDQRARYILFSAFLSGATNPPPKNWVQSADTWKPKDKDRRLTLTVPKGARQMALFLVPDTRGASDTIVDAVRDRPGEFVRAVQDLNQASLDRSRLNAFVAAIRAQENSHPEFLRTLAPALSNSLAIKLNADCLARVIELQAACLLENRDSLVLADIHSSSMTDTLIGAPTDLALQLSYTREAGLGYYSPYIGVIRDIARVFGAFGNPQFGYLPTLATREGERMSLLLNAAPSFAKPKSVLVAAMPAIDAPSPPRLRVTGDAPLCGARPGLVLPVEGAPLIYSTGFARNMMVSITGVDGKTIDLPVRARADRGGYVLTEPLPTGALSGKVSAKLHGQWGFDTFEGPSFTLQFPGRGDWRLVDAGQSLVVGRDNGLALSGPAAACVTGVTMRMGNGAAQAVPFTLGGADRIIATLPLKGLRAGDVTLEVQQIGDATPNTLTVRAYSPASRIDTVTLAKGDRFVTLTGQRLDEIAGIEIGDVHLTPADLTRDGDTDRLVAAAGQNRLPDGTIARIKLSDGRTLSVPITAAPPRPAAMLIARSLSPKDAAAAVALATRDETVLPDNARLTFSLRAPDGARLTPADAIEVATADGGASVTLEGGRDVRLSSPEVAVATLDPARLGPAAAGALRYRIVRGNIKGDWAPLATLVRLPRIDGGGCEAAGCWIAGRDLFLIDRVAATADMAGAITVPAGFTGARLTVPAAKDGSLYLALRDAPGVVFTMADKR
ncbi:hypothetical protein SOM26_07610 [Sphingomonas sp. CFBP8993]|uniref:hypothetical protein n=1 Tax=Sphingomonas sp. CFBP8993 TaxID=3096526 RepID=UPI002A6A7043|nr:hypothetical protein [Sphingomonas sp. CFBP8993]MDY0958549.1 hypothetical protein [Sphingomonas sp. CFBP8993]